MTLSSNVFINGRFLSQPLTGVQRYARNLLAHLDTLLTRPSSQSPRVFLTVPRTLPTSLPPLRHIGILPFGQFQGLAWEQGELYRLSRKGLLVNLGNSSPLLARGHLTVIHDLAALDHPEWFSPAFSLWYKLLIPATVHHARRIVTVSGFTAGRLTHWFPRSAGKITVIHPGADHREDGPSASAGTVPGTPYFLFVGTLEPRKNLAFLLQAWQDFQADAGNTRLLIVGAEDTRIFSPSGAHPPTPGVTFLGRVGEAELQALYGSALALVFPSRYEGFGFPVLEAMARGCPVIASAATSLPEVCGNAALFFTPEDSHSLANRLREVFGNRNLRGDLITRGHDQFRRFSWHHTARTFWGIIKEMLP